MFTDNTLSFNTNWATPQAISTATNVDSTGIVDVTGAGSGNAPAMIGGFPAKNTAMQNDYGSADGSNAMPWVYVTVTTLGTSGNTLTIRLESAPDNGSYGQGSYTILYQSAAIVASSMTVGLAYIFQVPPTPPGAALPRFYKLNYLASAALTVSVLAGILLNPPFPTWGGKYPANYIVV